VLTFHLERDGGSLRLGDREWQTEAGDVHLIAPGEIADPSGWVFLDSCVLECTAREERSAIRLLCENSWALEAYVSGAVIAQQGRSTRSVLYYGNGTLAPVISRLLSGKLLTG
jgi:hypothetical protein